MKKEYVLPDKQYGVCPKCGLNINKTEEDYPYNQMICTNCGTKWQAKYTYGYEDMIISESSLSNKEKKKQKENLIKKFEALKAEINLSIYIDDLLTRHNTLSVLDDEFRILCPKKYNAYFELGEFNVTYFPEPYKIYLNNRSNKMLRDIDKILFYFGK